MVLEEVSDIGAEADLPRRSRAAGTSRGPRLSALAVIVVLVAGGVGWIVLRDGPAPDGRGGGTGGPGAASASASPSTSSDLLQVGPTAIDPAQGIPSTQPTPSLVPAAPGSVYGVAQSSIPIVVQLHDVASTANHDIGLPDGAASAQATDLVRRFQDTIKTLERHKNTDRRLTTTLNRYLAIAKKLTKTAVPPAAALTTQLKAVDSQWVAALNALKGPGGTSLTTDLPPLLYPAVVAPSPSIVPTRD